MEIYERSYHRVLTVIGSTLTILWGIAHLFPTKNVVKDFGDVSEDNKNIIRMEWINEGVILIFLGGLLIASIIITGSITAFLNIAVIVMLLKLSVISIFTGFKVAFLPFKLCPVIFTLSSILIGLGIII